MWPFPQSADILKPSVWLQTSLWHFCVFLSPSQHISSRRHKDRAAGKPAKPKYSPYSKPLKGQTKQPVSHCTALSATYVSVSRQQSQWLIASQETDVWRRERQLLFDTRDRVHRHPPVPAARITKSWRLRSDPIRAVLFRSVCTGETAGPNCIKKFGSLKFLCAAVCSWIRTIQSTWRHLIQ